MKKSIFIALFLIPCYVIAQQGQFIAQSACENHNKFFKTGNYGMLQEVTDTIYPNGMVYFDHAKVQELGQEAILNMVGLDEGITFQLKGTQQSRFDEQKVFRRFQQYYNGIIVEGGGYAVSSRMVNGNPSVPGSGWSGLCDAVAMVAFYVLTEIGISTTNTIAKTSLPSILGVAEYQKAELVISHNITNNCEYNLAWKVDYDDDVVNKRVWIDAHDGSILREQIGAMFLTAPTEIYGNQSLNDFTSGNTTTLTTPDGKIIAYDFSGFSQCIAYENSFTSNFIPTTTNNQWTANDAPTSVYQGFYVTNLVKGYFQNININFDSIHIGVNCQQENYAYFSKIADVQGAFITTGRRAGASLATFDIIGHELGHVYLNGFVDYTTTANKSIHEGLADMLGTYVESKYPSNPVNGNIGGVDWIIGDDISWTLRDLANPIHYNCYDDVASLNDPDDSHDRSEPLGHWFFLITEGQVSSSIPALGIDKATQIVTDGLNLIGSNSDYPDLMAAIVANTLNDYGRCSPEFLAVARAWEAICVPTGYATVQGEINDCNFTIAGPSVVCEENDFAQFHVSGGVSNVNGVNVVYRWRIIGSKSTQYTSLQGMQGNTQYGGSSLVLTDFPKHDYYSQIMKIKVYSPTLGSQYSVTKTVKLNDCNGDDPTCDEYYGRVSPIDNGVNEYESLPFELELEEKEIIKKFVKVYDISGRLILTEQQTTFDKNRLEPNKIYFILYLGENGAIINSEKYIRLGY